MGAGGRDLFRESEGDGVDLGICERRVILLSALSLSFLDSTGSAAGTETFPSNRADDELGLNDFNAFRSGPTFFRFSIGGVPSLLLDTVFNGCSTADFIASELDDVERTGRRGFFWFAMGILVDVAARIGTSFKQSKSSPLSESESGVEMARSAHSSTLSGCVGRGAVGFFIIIASSESYGVSGWAWLAGVSRRLP